MTYRKYSPGIFVMICVMLLLLAGCEGGSLGIPGDGDGGAPPGNPVAGYAWSPATGWVNFNPLGYDGVRFEGTHFSGEAWGEHIGWISFGAKTSPSSCPYPYETYANQRDSMGEDCWGVLVRYVDATGDYYDPGTPDASADTPDASADSILLDSHLEGYAFNRSTGWINFLPFGIPDATDDTHGVGMEIPARGFIANLTGNAWAENTGWIHFRNEYKDATGNAIPYILKPHTEML